ncbi:MAG: SDR family NAD(P)-dependent oxidoreductase [Bacteroidota bacterium]|nr:SDR family NAD(P)-dependent oxidoreductase [Bacteroidota bacterium]
MQSPKRVIVTGASRGIGRALVDRFLDLGHEVWALSRNTDELNKIKGIHTVSIDLSEEQQIVDWVQSCGVDYFDAVINNAGMLINKPFAETTYADFEAVYRVNVFGAAQLIRHLLPLLTTDSHILNISSMGGVNGTAKFPGLAAYSSSKGALGILTELLAEEFKDNGPRCNALALGAVQTEMLAEAFPDYKAPVSAPQMATYIADFSLNGHHLYNGKVLPISQSTP